MTTFKNFISKLENTNTQILSIDRENRTIKFVPYVKTFSRVVYAVVKFDYIEGVKLFINIPNGYSSNEKLSVENEVASNYGLLKGMN